MIAQMYYSAFIEKIMAQVPNLTWQYQRDYRVVTKCSEDFPSIFFMFDGKWLEVSAHDYLFQQPDGETCTLLILPVDSPMNILGMPIFIDYYSVHDPETGKISWAPHPGSEKLNVQEGAVPPKSQVIEVFKLPVIVEPVNYIAVGSAWLITVTFVSIGYDFWAKFVNPTWVFTLDSARYFAVTFMLSLFTLIISVFSA